MAALERAIALEQVDGVAVAIAKNLDLDVARREDVFLDQHPRVAEGVPGFPLRGSQRIGEVRRSLDPAHALAAAAGHRLDQDGVSDRRRLRGEEVGLLAGAVIARHHRHAGFCHQRLRRILEAHGADGGGGRADEHDAGLRAGIREIRPLRQEAVARVDALGPARAGGLDDAVDAQVRGGGLGRADAVGFVGKRDVERIAVGLGMDAMVRIPRRLAVRITRQAISPRLAIRTEARRRVVMLSSHPEQAEPGLRHRRVEAGREREAEHPARLLGQDDAVVPQPRG